MVPQVRPHLRERTWLTNVRNWPLRDYLTPPW